ncbi:hypothetical protein [Microbacterium sp. No. 7]|uniref:hypothetical protein n=1 Tax=Microbacterium sp. No. 7 TaxID=1714373 RepID=UPI0006ED47A4|nr:hypothetical protein [Microbacterium sp. No. 7]ALJ19546.1 hypothetical protein AOA12_06335 [Microbacterium sp. No. 7]
MSRGFTDSDVRNAVAFVPVTSIGMEFSEREAAKFDSWLAEHDRQVAERAWGEGWAAAGAWQIAAPGTPYPWNPYRKEQS